MILQAMIMKQVTCQVILHPVQYKIKPFTLKIQVIWILFFNCILYQWFQLTWLFPGGAEHSASTRGSLFWDRIISTTHTICTCNKHKHWYCRLPIFCFKRVLTFSVQSSSVACPAFQSNCVAQEMQKSLKAFTSGFYMWKGVSLQQKSTCSNRRTIKNNHNTGAGLAARTQGPKFHLK